MLEIQNLCAGYPGKDVLKSIHFTAPAGKVTAIIGPNGCGKSTLLKTLCGILPVQSGQVSLGGQAILGLSSRELAKIAAYLPQSRPIPDMTAQRMVLHGRFPYLGYPRRYGKSDYAWADRAMEAMGISELADTPLQQLSGGQRQKVYIAMALAQDTPVILLDEPTTYLDISHQLQMMHLAKDLAARGKTVVMVIHDLPHALQTADHIVLLHQGTVAAQGTPEEIYASGKIPQVFQVALHRTEDKTGLHYYCEAKTI